MIATQNPQISMENQHSNGWRRVLASITLVFAVFASGLGLMAPDVKAEFGIPTAENTALVTAMKKFGTGNFTTCVTRPDGFPVCWGYNHNNSLGTGWASADKRGDVASEMGGALGRLVATSSTGQFYRRASAVFPGGDQTCVLDTLSVLRCTGTNNGGSLGRSDGLAASSYSQVTNDSAIVNLGTGRTAIDVANGGDSQAGGGDPFNCALLDDNSVKCWGNNASGQLGLGDTSNRGDAAGEMGDALPAVDLGTNVTAQAVSSGHSFVCAIVGGGSVPAGSVKCWGNNASGQLGLGDTSNRGDAAGEMGDSLPIVNIGAGRTAKAIGTGYNFACAIRDDNSVVCWGANGSHQIGRDTANTTPANNIGDVASEMGSSLIPVALGQGARQLAVGSTHVCALLVDGLSIKCWGSNYAGQLGQGDTTDRGSSTAKVVNLSAVDVGLNAGETVSAVDSGNAHVCVLTSTDRIKCWGSNTNGQLGLGDSNNRGDAAGEMGVNLSAVNYAATTPTEIVGVTSTSTATSVTFSWNAPEFPNGTITEYQAQCGRDSTFGAWNGTNNGFASIGAQSTLTVTSVWSGAVASGQVIQCNIRAHTSGGAGLSLRIERTAGIALTVTASSHSLMVGDSAPTITGTPSVNGVVRTGETCSTTYTTSSPAGIYPTTCSGGTATGYSIDYVAGTISVTSPLTVTASSHNIVAGSSVPTITGTPSVNGVVRTGETCSTTYTTSSPAGIYPATCSGGTATGYTVTYVNGSVTVTEAPTTTTTTPTTTTIAPTTTTVAPTTTSTTVASSPVIAAGAPTLITPTIQSQLTAAPGEANALINGKVVPVETVKVPVDASPASQIAVAEKIVDEIADVLPKGTKNPLAVVETPEGAEISGLMTNPDDPTEKLNVPVESVTLVKAGESKVLISALNQTNLPAEVVGQGILQVTRGGLVAAQAYGLPGLETGEIVLMSTPRLLKSFTVDKNGTYAGQVPLPKDISFGSHTVVMATKNAKVSLGIKLVRTKMQFRIKRKIGTTLFRNRAGVVKKGGGKVTISATGRCRANSKRIVMASKPGGCYITVRQASKGNNKAIYYRFTVSVVKKVVKPKINKTNK